MDLTAYLTPHFRLSEFASKDGAGFPSSVIDDLTKQAQLLEIIREAAGNKPISINSGYRSPGHNTAVGGATHSQHVEGTAADFNIAGMSPRATTDLITGLIDQGRLPAGGLGVYNNWVHYDHRPNGNARWAGDGGPVPARAKVVNNGFAMQPEVSGAAPVSFVDAPQGSIPAESPKMGVFDPATRDLGMETTRALLNDLKSNAGSFNYADRLKAREAFQQQVMDRYGESQDMSLGDIPGAVIGAPVLALKHLLAPLRRAMGNREQANLDMWGGQGGLETLAAISGDPTIAEKYAETPGAGAWLKSLVTDSQERRASAARAALARMGLYDKKMAEDSRTFLTEAQTAAMKANALQSAMAAYNQTADTEYGRVVKGTAAYQNTMQGNEAAERTRWIGPAAVADIGRTNATTAKENALTRGYDIDNEWKPKLAGAEIGQKEASARASDAAAEASYANAGLRDARTESLLTKLPGEIAFNDAQIRGLGAKTAVYEAQTKDILADVDKTRQEIENLKKQGLLTDAQIEVMDKRGILLEANFARMWLDAENSTRLTDARIGYLNMDGQRADAARAAAAAQAERTKKLIEAADQKLPLELQVLNARIGNLNAKAGKYGSALGADLRDPASGAAKARALTLLALKRGEALDLQNQGMDVKTQLAVDAANDKKLAARNDARDKIAKMFADGTYDADATNQALRDNGIDNYGVVDQRSLPGRMVGALPFVGDWLKGPDYKFTALPTTPKDPPSREVIIRKGNVGGAQESNASRVSENAAAAIQRGDISPERYMTGDRAADEARLIADHRAGKFTDDDHFRRIARQAGLDDQ